MIAHEHPPTVAQTAVNFDIGEDKAREAYRWLHNKHALFLDEVTGSIRMLNPFSGVETSHIVKTQGHTYYANCAWDLFGIAVVLKTPYASLETRCPESREPITVELEAGRITKGDGIVHFLVPFKDWYEDLVYT